jgi:hypothetical protein
MLEAGDGFNVLVAEPLLARDKILVAFSGRRGGVSEGAFSSLNLGLHVGDNPERVIANRERILSHFDLNIEDAVCAEQVHGTRVQRVSSLESGRGARLLTGTIAGTDALTTDQAELPLMLFFADCVPIIVVEPKKRIIAVAHAGWRGVYGNIVESTTAAMVSSWNLSPQNLFAFIGPSICGCCYEVSSEVMDAFKDRFMRFDGWRHENRINLVEIARLQLTASGISPQQIISADICTACRHQDYFSYRADSGITGRHAAIAAILSESYRGATKL